MTRFGGRREFLVPKVAIGRTWRGVLGLCGLILLGGRGWPGAVFAEPRVPAARAQQPYLHLRPEGTCYHGPGRGEAVPEDLTSVPIAFFGPRWEGDEETDVWVAAQLALDEANAAGGYREKPFEMVVAWSDDPWGSGTTQLARLIYEQPVKAILGAFDGHSAHLAALLVAKARLPVVLAITSDQSVPLANVPWVYSLLPGDHLQAPPLADAVAAELISDGSGGRLVVLSSEQHDARYFGRELLSDLARRHRITPRFHLESRADAGEVAPQVQRALAARPDALVVLAGPEDSARLVRAVWSAGYGGPVFGGAAMGRRVFHERLGDPVSEVIYPCLFRPGESSQAFVTSFQAVRGYPPDYAAAHAYDATRLIIQAIRAAGLNRPRINDAIRELAPWEGITGTVDWDPVGSNERTVRDVGSLQGMPSTPKSQIAPVN